MALTNDQAISLKTRLRTWISRQKISMAGKARFTEWIKTMFEGYGDLLAYFENSSMYNFQRFCLTTVFLISAISIGVTGMIERAKDLFVILPP